MSGFEAFLKQNKKKTEHKKVAASTAFLDTEGKPLLWEIRPLSSREAERIRTECNSIDKGGRVHTDNARFNCMVAAKCTVYPNLNDKELQDSYGVMGAEELVHEMLDKDGEYQDYIQKILELSGYKDSDAELEKEAKN